MAAWRDAGPRERNTWEGCGVAFHDDRDPLPEQPLGDRFIAAVLVLAAGAFAVMLVWLLAR